MNAENNKASSDGTILYEYINYTKKCARYLEWDYDEVWGSSTLLEDLLEGNWDEKRFLFVRPGQKIIATNDTSPGISSGGATCRCQYCQVVPPYSQLFVFQHPSQVSMTDEVGSLVKLSTPNRYFLLDSVFTAVSALPWGLLW